MRKVKSCAFLFTFILALALLIMPFGRVSVSADESLDTQVTATTSASVKQGNSEYCYVYIDSLESLSALSVTVHYDADKVAVQSDYVYNTVSSLLNDKSVSESSVQFSYIFDGNGEAEKTQLFYFIYTVRSDAEVCDTYFDIVVNEAYDSSLQPITVSGSRCSFKVAETVTAKNCYIYSSLSIATSIEEEFELSYELSDYQIASGSFSINYDPELFEVVGVTNGAFCDNKIVDVNTKLAGSVYVSFVGTEYNYGYDLVKVKFKTLKNVAEESTIKMVVTEFYDLELNPISCSGYTTTANIAFDETYTEDAPSMSLQAAYNAITDKVTLTVKLDCDSMLGAGDFVLRFNTNYLTYNLSGKGFSPTFFNINDKNVSDGILKFSIISLSNITDEQIVLTVTFDVEHACEDKLVDFDINGSGLTDALTNTIVLNFVDASVTIPLEHTATTATTENRVEPTCTADGRYDSVVYCSVCDTELSRENKVIDKLGHDHSTEWTVDIKPTCTTEGSKSHHCLRCGDKSEVTEIPSNGHSFGDWYVTNEPTESIQGEKRRDCSNCSDYETSAIAVLEHDHSRWETIVLEAKAPTCTLSGLTQGSKCSKCGEILITQNTIAANGHSYGDWYTVVAPTCTDEGTNEHECSVCYNKETTPTDAKGHTNAEAVVENKIDANCTVDGKYDSVIYCSACGDELSRESKVINKLGHNYSTEWTVDIQPTCTMVGSKSRHCTECGDKVDVTELSIIAHPYGEWYEITAPTCTTSGSDEHKCSVCQHTETRTVDALGHNRSDAVEENKTNSTCTENGSYDSVIYCSVCKAELERETITNEKLGHNYSDEWTEDIAPTCTTVGSKSHHCLRCDDKADVIAIPVNGHSYGGWYEIQAPTCTAMGTEEHKCSVCQHTETKETTALGHKEANAVEENKNDATCTSDGSYDSVIYCLICGDELSRETKTIAMVGHDYETVVTASTCTEKGYTTYMCLRCSDSYVSDYVNALGHIEVTDEAVVSTCTTTGLTEGKHCSVCGEVLVEQEVVPALGHNYNGVVTAPTCTEKGYTTYTCQCGDKYEDDYVNANGHSYSEWIIVKEPTGTESGTKEKTCQCGHVIIEEIPAIGTSINPDDSSIEDDASVNNGANDENANMGGCFGSIQGIIPSVFTLISVTMLMFFKKKKMQ